MNDNTVKANQAGVDPKQKLVNDILYVIGAALFMAIGSLLTWGPFALNCLELGDDLRSSCRMIEQFTCSITMIGAGFLSFVRTRNLPNQASLCFVSLIAGLIMSLVSKYGIHAEIAYYFAVACIGLGEGMLFILWMEIIAKQSIHDMKKLLLIANILAGMTICCLALLPSRSLLPLIAFLLVPLVIVLTHVNLKGSPSTTGGRESAYSSCMAAGKGLVVPFLCVIVFFFVDSTIDLNWDANILTESFRIVLSQVARIAGTAIVAFIWFGLDRDITIPRLYVFSWPVLATIFVFASFIHETASSWVFVLMGETCGAVMSIMMIVLTVEQSRKYQINPQILYGIFAGIAYLTRPLFIPLLSNDFLSSIPEGVRAISMALLLVYLLTIPLFIIIRQELQTKREREMASADTIQMGCFLLAERRKLSPRQSEILCLLATGRDVPYIAKELSLAENTIRTYKKSLYVALGVHSQQELISLVEHVYEPSDSETPGNKSSSDVG